MAGINAASIDIQPSVTANLLNAKAWDVVAAEAGNFDTISCNLDYP
jgi:hypothetical protein